ncbi:MAG: hypothetical protein AAF416_04675 [Pseudomonadota bacterium]
MGVGTEIDLENGGFAPVGQEAGSGHQPSERDATDVRLLCGLAAAHALFGRYESAASLLDFAAWIDRGDRRVDELKAMVEMRRGRLDLSLEAIRRLRAKGHALPRQLRQVETRAALRGIE